MRAVVLVPAILVLMGLLSGPPPAFGQTVKQVFEKVSPSVVVILGEGRVIGPGRVAGSGVLIAQDGKVLTAARVVLPMSQITVEVMGQVVPARVVASVPTADLALLELGSVPSGARAAPLADSDTVKIGDPIFIVGTPYGRRNTLGTGLITGRVSPPPEHSQVRLAEFLQTDAAINPGNEGGPMFNMAGEVLGIVSHTVAKSGGSEGLGFAVTVNTAKKWLLSLGGQSKSSGRAFVKTGQ